MQLNLLFLPLLGGFVFYMKWNFTRYHAARCVGQRLLFTSAAFGLGLLVLSRSLVMATEGLVEIQRPAIEIVSYFLIGSAVSTLLSLAFIAQQRSIDEELRDDLGQKKPWAGLLIASAVVVSAWFVYYRVPGSPTVGTWLRITVATAIATALAVSAARFIRSWFRTISEGLYLAYRESALFFRASLVLFLASDFTLLWLYNADVADRLWALFSPHAYSGTAFLACVLGLFGWWPSNLLFPKEAANAVLHRDLKTNSLERLLYAAADEWSFLILTLKDGKVYVGVVGTLPPDPASTDAYLELLPFKSGYRDKDKKTLHFTTHYEDVYESIDAASKDALLHDFTKVIPIADIESIGRFREDVYLEFVKRGSPTAVPPPPAEEPSIKNPDVGSEGTAAPPGALPLTS